MGSLVLGASALALAAGAASLGVGLAALMGALAAFVAISNVCVPSMVFTLLWGRQKATAATLVSAAGRSAVPATSPVRVR